MDTFALVILILAAMPAVMFIMNLCFFRPPRWNHQAEEPTLSLLIPARDEEANIGGALDRALALKGVKLEVVVMNDGSTDRTAEIVEEKAREHPEIRLENGAALPSDWAGKQFACWQLANKATQDWLLFIDADVRLNPESARRMIDHARFARNQPALISGIPQEVTGTWLEKLLIPQFQLIILSYFPSLFMKLFKHPAFGTGFGQIMLANREAYLDCGGHSRIRGTFHDGVKLPKAFRNGGYKTDMVDLSRLACCRMYENSAQVWSGMLKNTHEGVGAPGSIVPMTAMLAGAFILPWVMLPFTCCLGDVASQRIWIACGLSLIPPFLNVIAFRNPVFGAILQPLGALLFLIIQWLGLFRHFSGQSTSWKGRAAPSEG